MFVKSLFLTAVTLSLSMQVHGHATFAPNQAAADAVKRSDIKRAPNPCVAATALKTPIPIDGKGQFVAFARSFNAGKDGATTIKAGQVDASAAGQNFKDGDVKEVSGGVASQPDNKGRQTVTFAMPKGVKCAGGADKSSCLVSLTTSAGFVNCVAVTQAGSNADSETKAAAGNKQAASSSSAAEATSTASNSAASTATSTASETATSTSANPSATETGSANSDTQASQQVTAALKQVAKIRQELDALIKSLGGNNNANKNTAGEKKAAATKKAAKKAAADKKAKDAQKNDSSTTSSAASATQTSASETATETGASETTTATSTGEVPAETGTPIIGRDLEDDGEDDAFSDLDELSARDLEDDEDVEVEDDEE